MEMLVKVGWLALALVHVAPAAAFAFPRTLERLYGVRPDGEIGVLLVHRGALFGAIVVLCAYASFDPTARRVASLAVAVSVVGFLLTYARAGAPAGPLRAIAAADAAALLPLALVCVAAWRAPA